MPYRGADDLASSSELCVLLTSLVNSAYIQLFENSASCVWVNYIPLLHDVYALLYSSSGLSLKCALRECGRRIGYEPTKMSRDDFWRSISRDTNVEVSAVSPLLY